MSCNGCRVLRKGCSEGCALRPCLQWIETAEAQGFATLFLAKFFGRAGLMEFITAVPLSQRPALFQSLLYEACGRTVNPVYGAVGLLWSGKWHVCQEAVDKILNGRSLNANSACNSNENMSFNFDMTSPNSMMSAGHLGNSHAIIPSRSIFSMHTQMDRMPNLQQHKTSISASSGFKLFEESHLASNTDKRLKITSDNFNSRSLALQARPTQGVLGCSFITSSRRHQQNMITSCRQTIIQHRETQRSVIGRSLLDEHYTKDASEEVHLAVTLNSNEQSGSKPSQSGSEGSIITSYGSPFLSSIKCQNYKRCPSSKPLEEDTKLLNLLT